MSYILSFLYILFFKGAISISEKAPLRFLKNQKILILTIISVIFSLVFFQMGVSVNTENLGFNSFYKFISAFILFYVLIEIKDMKLEKSIVVKSTLSLILPVACALLVAILYYGNTSPSFLVGLACVFSISAVPVLFFYLKEMQFSAEKTKEILSIAILIDIICWLSFGMVVDSITLEKLSYLVLSLFCFYILSKTLGFGFIWLALIYFLLYMNSGLYLIFLILGIILSKKNNISIDILHEQKIEQFAQYICLPIVFGFSLLKVDWNAITSSWNYQEFLILFLVPIISKMLGVKLFLDKKLDYTNSILLNTRGLTEIIFLNILMQYNIINNNMYLYLIIMSLFSTILPSILREKLNGK